MKTNDIAGNSENKNSPKACVAMMKSMLYGGGGFIHLWPSAVILCIFPLLALSLLPHLKRAIESHKYENIK